MNLKNEEVQKTNSEKDAVSFRPEKNTSPIVAALANDYPVLYLNPDHDSIESYRMAVQRGEEPQRKTLDHYQGDVLDSDETVSSPAGPVRVITLGNRHDFELVIRGLMAAREGPDAKVPESQGAAMLRVFNWPRIHAHLAGFPEPERNLEFKRFTSVKDNYLDRLVILSRGPYSHVDAAEAGFDETEWLQLSDTIRRYHEITHVICRRLFPENIEAVRDELVADAVGLVAAFGAFDPELEKKFLGIRDGRYTGGRLGNYTDEPEITAESVCTMLSRFEEVIRKTEWESPYDLIPPLMNL
ncbi:MAG: hypothetical protein IKG87_09105 [Clostridia bacterium]|nr:hypothetical protein [Clostridia bacterium]